MSKILAVFGATGAQGSSVINTVLGDSALGSRFKIRALSRNATGKSAQDLRGRGVDVAEFDPQSRQSIQTALQGVHTVFLMTVTDYSAKKEDEYDFACKVADIAVAEKVSHLIFSTLPSPAKVSGGKYLQVDGFDIKAEIEAYIRSLPIKQSFLALGTFMNNFVLGMKPRPSGDGTYSIHGVSSPTTQFPLFDTAGDTGKYVAALLFDPDDYNGKVLYCASDLRTMDEITQIYSKTTGKTVEYKQIPPGVFGNFIPNKRMAGNLTEMTLYFQDFGYFGLDTKSKIESSAKVARGHLTTFEEFLRRESPELNIAAQ